MVCTLDALSPNHAFVREQSLASLSIPTLDLDEVFSRLLRVTSILHSSLVKPNSSTLVSTMLNMAVGRNKVVIIVKAINHLVLNALIVIDGGTLRSSIAFVAHSSNSFVFVFQASLRVLVLDFGAFDHIFSNSLTFSHYLFQHSIIYHFS